MDGNAIFKDVDVISILEASIDGILLCDFQGKTIFVNSSAERIMGIQGSEFIGINSIQLQHSGVITHATSAETLRTGKPFTTLQTYKNGKMALVSSNVVQINGTNPYVFINIRDVSMPEEVPLGRGCPQYASSPVCKSKELLQVFEVVRTVAQTEATVLLTGETGVGKDVVAKQIHSLSKRSEKGFVKVNCGNLPEHLIESELFGYDSGAFTGALKGGKSGLVEFAEQGTLFLDEVGELPLAMQPKLLELLQDFKFNRVGSTVKKTADIRIIASTNKNLEEQVEKGLFRADLYYRLNVIPIEIPPLRKRAADIIPLIENYLQIFNKKYKVQKVFDQNCYSMLLSYAWPGNVRELENTVERLVVTTCCDTISEDNISKCLGNGIKCNHGEIVQNADCKSAVKDYEKALICQYLQIGYSTDKIGKLLNVSQSTSSRKIARYFPNWREKGTLD